LGLVVAWMIEIIAVVQMTQHNDVNSALKKKFVTTVDSYAAMNNL